MGWRGTLPSYVRITDEHVASIWNDLGCRNNLAGAPSRGCGSGRKTGQRDIAHAHAATALADKCFRHISSKIHPGTEMLGSFSALVFTALHQSRISRRDTP